MKEKRKYVRIAVPLVVTYKVIGAPPINKKTVSKDFSEGGLRFTVYEKLDPGTTLELHIETPFDTIPISTNGQIVWIKSLGFRDKDRESYDVGVKFTEMQSFDRKRMTETSKHFLKMDKKYQAK
jgi:c-di-GMP-binding flagellar brake protein YcgR